MLIQGQYKRTPSGMTLIEIMIAIAVLAIALTGTLSLWIAAEREASLAREEAVAQNAINQIISDMRATPWHQIPSFFSGGWYDGTGTTSYRYKPMYFNSKTDFDQNSAVYIALDTLPGGCLVSQTKPAKGQSIFMEGRYYSYVSADVKPELRVILINDECPVESELGETNGDGDGLDLNRDGVISTTPMDPLYLQSTTYKTIAARNKGIMGCDCTSLFPRQMAIGTSPEKLTAGQIADWTGPHALVHQYWPISQLFCLPVAVQARWWSKAGIPRVITVVTFLTNRAGKVGY